MNTCRWFFRHSWFVLFVMACGIQHPAWTDPRTGRRAPGAGPRQHLLMDFGWRFALGNSCDPVKDFGNGTGYFSYFAKAGYGDGAAARDFDDRGWRVLDLPHDWAAEMPMDPRASASHGYRALGRGFPESSIGWYRRTFSIPQSDFGKRVMIDFDGVFRNSLVWVNGFLLGREESGYCGFHYDITDYLTYGGENTVAVRVDASMEEGWFYEGAGIYRHVWLTVTEPLHVATDGVVVSTELHDGDAEILARATIQNDGTRKALFQVEETVVDGEGNRAAQGRSAALSVLPGTSQESRCSLRLPNPSLWSPDSPHLYRLITIVRAGGRIVDRLETRFGVRTLRFDPDSGFFLNGKHLLLKGTNNHQDHAGVGTAVPDALLDFRIKRLKEMGSNSCRCSHNPPAPEFLDACDRLGMLVIDENRQMGSSPRQLDQVKSMILRDINHPSVIIWSIGNEEWAMEGTITGARVAETMQAFVRSLDPTRRITYANSGWGKGISDVMDVMGYNYIFNGNIDTQHVRFPAQPSIGTEESTSSGTRGVYEDDSAHGHMEALDRSPSRRGIETGFQFYAARPFLSGLFYWTGFDYRGEPRPWGWPQVGSQYGILDNCGFPKDMFYYLKSWWTGEPVLHIFPHWTWNGREGTAIDTWAYTNCDSVELFLNGVSLGRRTTPLNSHLSWMVRYEPGTLLARGYRDGRAVIADSETTTGPPAAIRLLPDRDTISADGRDVSVVAVQVTDSAGRLVPFADDDVALSIAGPAAIIGVGNGDPSSHEPDWFGDQIRLVPIERLRIHEVPGMRDRPEVAAAYNDSAWHPAFDGHGELSAETSMVLRGDFILPDITDSARVTLLAKSLGEVQSVFVNGHRVAEDVRRGDPHQTYLLDRAILHPGRNVYALAGKPLVRRSRWEILNADPGLVQIRTPSPAWHRHVFNGLAQVIVQSRKQCGDIVLTAASGTLRRGVLTLQSTPAEITPSVPVSTDDGP